MKTLLIKILPATHFSDLGAQEFNACLRNFVIYIWQHPLVDYVLNSHHLHACRTHLDKIVVRRNWMLIPLVSWQNWKANMLTCNLMQSQVFQSINHNYQLAILYSTILIPCLFSCQQKMSPLSFMAIFFNSYSYLI